MGLSKCWGQDKAPSVEARQLLGPASSSDQGRILTRWVQRSHLCTAARPEVFSWTKSLGVKMIMRYDDPGQNVTDAHVRAWRDNRRERRGDAWNEYDDAAISPDRPVADMFPYISTVKIGRDGRIWVKRSNLPSEERGWLAFGADGGFVCHLAAMPSYVWEFGEDYVLLESEEGTPTVRMHELKPPS